MGRVRAIGRERALGAGDMRVPTRHSTLRPLSWLPFLLVTGLILLLSTDITAGIYGSLRRQIPAGAREHAGTVLQRLFYKAGHLASFLLLGLCMFPLRAAEARNRMRTALILCATVALGSELFQLWFPTRTPSVRDVALNLAAAGVAVRYLFVRPRLSKNSSVAATRTIEHA